MSVSHDVYVEKIVPGMISKFKYKNKMQVPKLVKVILNIGMSTAEKDISKALENAKRDLLLITGQKAIFTMAKKSIATFKLRKGMKLGCKVTLRGTKMLYFLDKLINVSLARVRDFHGVSANSFDGRGNYSIGIKEQLIFPEIEYDKIDKIRGMNIVIVTTAKNDLEAKELLSLYGMPFKKN